jgi:hypothetical protein
MGNDGYGHDLYEHGSEGAYMGEVLREHARAYGRENPNCAWINSPWDTWEPNPFYQGKPQPHPESEEH